MELEVNEKYKAVYETEMSRKPKTEWDDNCCSCQSESTEGEAIWCGLGDPAKSE